MGPQQNGGRLASTLVGDGTLKTGRRFPPTRWDLD